MADLMDRVAAGKIDPVYILSSDQPLLLERAVQAIADATVPANARGFNYEVLEGKGLTAARILAAAQTLPMMAQRRMILVRDLAPMPAAELTRLVSYLDAPSPTTVLVAVTSKLDKRLKFYAAANKKKRIHELGAPRDARDLAAWLRAEAGVRQVDIEPRACARLVDVVGKDLARLVLALDQLALYAEGRRVTADDVDDLIAETRERTVFELTDAMGAGDLVAALRAVGSLCEQRQSPIGVVVMLARHMRQIGLYHSAAARGLARRDMAAHVGVREFLLGKLQAHARRYPADVVAVALSRLAAADRALKGQDASVKVLGRELAERVILDRVVRGVVSLSQS